MTSSDTGRVPWWHLTKAQKKSEIEAAVRELLDRDVALTDRDKFFLARALGHVARGQFGSALQDIIDAHEPDSAFSPSFKISLAEIEGVAKESLLRALCYSEAAPPQEYPIFR